jgi:hypothetical protein
MTKKVLLIVVPSLVVGLLSVARAAADSRMTLVVGPSATLTDRILVTAPVTITCSPLVSDLFSGSPAAPFLQVTVSQAAGKTVHGGSNVMSLPASSCDNTAHTMPVSVTGGPFHGGTAIISASAYMCGFLTTPVGTSTSFICENANAGPLPVKLTH